MKKSEIKKLRERGALFGSINGIYYLNASNSMVIISPETISMFDNNELRWIDVPSNDDVKFQAVSAILIDGLKLSDL